MGTLGRTGGRSRACQAPCEGSEDRQVIDIDIDCWPQNRTAEREGKKPAIECLLACQAYGCDGSSAA